MLLCPVCSSPLTRNGNTYRCENRHSSDISPHRYVNLLSPRTHGAHGDNAEMIRARRDFLSAGHYAPLARALCDATLSVACEHMVLLDAGCGEGYYTDAIMQTLVSKYPDTTGYGIDISKDALRYAGGRGTVKAGALSLFAAGVYHMPFSDGSISLIVNTFSPLALEEYRRLLPSGGHLLMAVPGRRHLYEMKEILYDTPYENEVKPFDLDGFSLLREQKVFFPMALDAPSLQDLFLMTPYAYRTPRAGRDRLLALPTLSVSAQFHLLLYARI